MSAFVFLYLVSLYLYLRICISSEFFSDFTWRPAAVCQGRELVRGHVGWESDLHSPLSSNSNSNSHLSSTLPGMITCAIFLVLALNHFNQADDAVSFETSTVCKKIHLLQPAFVIFGIIGIDFSFKGKISISIITQRFYAVCCTEIDLEKIVHVNI